MEDYDRLMFMNIDELSEKRISASERIIALKKIVVRAYNKYVKMKQFGIGDLVWKILLPMNLDGEKIREAGL